LLVFVIPQISEHQIKKTTKTTGQLLDNLHPSGFQFFMVEPEGLFSEKRDDLSEKKKILDSFTIRIPGKKCPGQGNICKVERERAATAAAGYPARPCHLAGLF
jgi:hypothetical protein